MMANIFDLIGRERYCRAEYRDEFETNLLDPMSLRNLLIYPDPTGNRLPYLQDPESPELTDFAIRRGKCDFSNSWFLSDLLNGAYIEGRWDKLEDYFNSQLGLIEGFDRRSDNIVLVRDRYDSEEQERLLRCCSMPRNNTLLLWRSIAVCLGAEEKIEQLGAHDGTRVAIVDCLKNGGCDIAILTMRCDEGRLVPVRSSFKKKKNYPLADGSMGRDSKIPVGGRYEFWRHTWQREGKFIVMDEDGCWRQHHFPVPKLIPNFPIGVNADIVVVAGAPSLKHYENIADSQIICEAANEDFGLLGAGRFAARNHSGKPTYFDECEPFYFIFQDNNEEKVLPKKLIDGGDLCKGGKRIEGIVNTDFCLMRDSAEIRFLLYVGEIDNNTQLKALTLPFNDVTKEDQPLMLYPSMIPGQGIARVEVDASPLLQERVELDFSTMDDAKQPNGRPESISSLEARMPRSFPIDFPEAEASFDLYSRHCASPICSFLKRENVHLSGDCFAHTTWPNIGGSGIEVFKRLNVFGTKKGSEYPLLRDKEMFHEVFAKIAEQYRDTYAHGGNVDDYIRLAAWTYRCGREEFKEIIDRTLVKIQQRAKMLNQEFTVCCNMLSCEEQEIFIKSFIPYAADQVADADRKNHIVNKVDWWIRALMGILIYSNDVLANIPSEECERGMTVLLRIWRSYELRGKDYFRYTRKVVLCMLFMLRRRKYDHGFLREDTSELYKDIMMWKTSLQEDAPLLTNPDDKLIVEFFKEVENKGSLDGLASAASEAIMGNDDN